MSLAVQGSPKFYAKTLSSYKDAFVQRLQVGVSDSDSNTLCAVDGGIEESFANFLNDISRLDLTSFSTAARRKLFNALSGPSCLSFLVQVPHPAMDRYVVGLERPVFCFYQRNARVPVPQNIVSSLFTGLLHAVPILGRK